ncbi:hypothetical protein NQ314_014213 [Rhamnusium bicolor]|uniref:DDE Tnp4 domain-containing protein n=1 Tax=Rhamnusium bicolor TaxID=1586634 RepID=A0AAV8X2P8_9CUCU|nr:hypothetical protein NQ314_014213 [Rhamnusium bicolor]
MRNIWINSVQDICNTIIACCTLHNICIFNEDENNLQELIDEGRGTHHIPKEVGLGNYDDAAGIILREQLTQTIYNQRHQ